jgi:hypothetical protein
LLHYEAESGVGQEEGKENFRSLSLWFKEIRGLSLVLECWACGWGRGGAIWWGFERRGEW